MMFWTVTLIPLLFSFFFIFRTIFGIRLSFSPPVLWVATVLDIVSWIVEFCNEWSARTASFSFVGCSVCMTGTVGVSSCFFVATGSSLYGIKYQLNESCGLQSTHSGKSTYLLISIADTVFAVADCVTRTSCSLRAVAGHTSL